MPASVLDDQQIGDSADFDYEVKSVCPFVVLDAKYL